MAMREIRRLNEKGVLKFARDVWGQSPPGEPPMGILYDDDYSEVITFSNGHTRQLDSDAVFTTGKEMVELLDDVFGDKISWVEIVTDKGLMAWLALRFYHCLRKGGPGNWKGAAMPRFIVGKKWGDEYRHLIAFRYSMWKQHGEHAMVILHGPANNWGEVPEQVLSVTHLANSTSVVGAVNLLYYDASKVSGIKTGAGGKGPGSPRRFRDVQWQFESTYDLRSMSPEQIIALLPDEFNDYKPVIEGGEEE